MQSAFSIDGKLQKKKSHGDHSRDPVWRINQVGGGGWTSAPAGGGVYGRLGFHASVHEEEDV